MMNHILLVGAGGAAGSILRFLIQRNSSASFFPYGTLVVNLAGCFLIGLLWGFSLKNYLSESNRLLLMTGFCGGFTSFSAFTYESVQMIQGERWSGFMIYMLASVAGGILLTFLGFKISN